MHFFHPFLNFPKTACFYGAPIFSCLRIVHTRPDEKFSIKFFLNFLFISPPAASDFFHIAGLGRINKSVFSCFISLLRCFVKGKGKRIRHWEIVMAVLPLGIRSR
ncbi:unnamed protein product [Citrullus colocynthis]|uniref:Uncharacterized protein n=1 Tax=Citrullus colocynthis TaxID=252529 RepID=A0ABP0Y290_9ROSI